MNADFINCEPDGVNINNECGSTHMDQLKEKVVSGGYDLGIAFDGDADRWLAVDEKGNEVDGDKIMAACAQYERERGMLNQNAIVATVMSNMGMHVYCRENGLKLVCTDVGDRHVLEKMLECGYCIGGEQSGHIIFTRFATTGDGELAALRLLKALDEKKCTLSELVGGVPTYPQIMMNVKVGGNEEKKRLMEDETLNRAVREGEKELGDSGRILVRASGTEALIRVMVEAKTEETAQNMAKRLVNLVAGL